MCTTLLTIDLEQRRHKRVKRPKRHSDRITLAQIVRQPEVNRLREQHSLLQVAAPGGER